MELRYLLLAENFTRNEVYNMQNPSVNENVSSTRPYSKSTAYTNSDNFTGSVLTVYFLTGISARKQTSNTSFIY